MNKLKGRAPILVAHRGYSGRYPENTLLSYQAAYEHGARYLELDLQMTRDRVPVLHHDQSLMRMAGVDLDVRDISAKQFKSLKASYPERFAEEFADNCFTTFRRFCNWLKKYPDVTVFVEMKQESIDRFDVPVFFDEVQRRILKAEVESQCVIISFNDQVIEYSRKISPMRTGWVIPRRSDRNRDIAKQLKPDFLFCDKAILPKSDQEIWQGSWQWAVYNLDDVASAVDMANRGIPFLETNQIGTLMQDSELSNRKADKT
ncbi:MAG: hypothetical protein KJP04_07555 [Arenicella sp.]|nr:hypothetical protein [Arenicella sp.]